ncbi:hypothetical protein TNCV_4844781 [Trichonephila clavipes]|uniref:Uncharacterized protein n=1 Tax=Trichonephila clavipes TaxID=2585209 RepID=A0A8X7BL87_TRICX|nr:hypothetical protein TNCV_4844781 [Trichonephila clavipes]
MAFAEQRMKIKFSVRLVKSDTSIHGILKLGHGSDTLSETRDFDWHRCFREGRENFEDDGCFGCPQTSRTAENIEKVSAVVREKRL